MIILIAIIDRTSHNCEVFDVFQIRKKNRYENPLFVERSFAAISAILLSNKSFNLQVNRAAAKEAAHRRAVNVCERL